MNRKEMNEKYQKQKELSNDRLKAKHSENNRTFPTHMIIEINSGCKNPCSGCCRPNNKFGVMDEKLLDNVLNYSLNHFFGINLLGGEPTDVLDLILEKCVFPDMQVIITTNGQNIDDLAAKAISEAGNILPILSIDGSSPYYHEVSRIPGSFNRTQKTIKHLTDYETPFGVSTVVNSHNFQDIISGNMAEYVERIGASTWTIVRYYPMGHASEKIMFRLAMSKTQLKELEEYRAEFKNKNPDISFEFAGSEARRKKKNCGGSFTIGIDGGVAYCPFPVWTIEKIDAKNCDAEITRKLTSKSLSWRRFSLQSKHYCPMYSNIEGFLRWNQEHAEPIVELTGILKKESPLYNYWLEVTAL
jgi:MoaA/NifB/PqqE/SkfB family radical SAM enzyme